MSLIMRFMRTWSWTLIPVLVAASIGWYSASPLSAQLPEMRRADSSSFLPGELDRDAVARAQQFDEFPLLWVGEELDGFRLTNFVRRVEADPDHPKGGRDSVSLVYGSCVAPDPERPSCVPPVSIIIWAPGNAPAPDEVDPIAAGPVTVIRGLQAREVSTGTMLWTGGGIAITVHSNAEMRSQVLDALELANGGAVGLAPIGPSQPLDVLRASD